MLTGIGNVIAFFKFRSCTKNYIGCLSLQIRKLSKNHVNDHRNRSGSDQYLGVRLGK